MLENIIKIEKLTFIVVVVLFIIMYFPRFIAWFSGLKKQPALVNPKKNKIALIIPARDEMLVIGDLFASIKAQTYSKEDFDVFVLVKSENDPVIELSKSIGYIPYVIKTQTCKGDALDYCMKKILREKPGVYNAYLVVDADCVMADDYLEQMNNALHSNRQVVLSKKLVKNYLSNAKGSSSIISQSNGLIWTMIDDMGNRYKSDHNITIMTIGTGLMLRSDVVEELGGWPYRKTLTEDIEFMYDCELKGFTTYYYSHAIIYVEESTSLRVTNKRRTRWLTGVVDSKRLYHDRIKENISTFKEKYHHYFTTNLNLVYKYIGFMVLFFFGNLIFAGILGICNIPSWSTVFVLAMCGWGAVYTSFFLLTLMCLIVDGKHIKASFLRKIFILFYHPIFYMGYIPIIAKALFLKGNRGWEVIERMNFKESDIN